MDDEADAAREYDRLRAELADFVLDAVARRVAEGGQPELSRALTEAIERRVDEAVSARLGKVEWPDPDAFADSVITAAAARGGNGAGDRIETSASRARRSGESRSAPPRRGRRMSAGQWALIALIGIAALAALAYFVTQGRDLTTNSATNSFIVNTATGVIEPTPDGAANAQQPPASGAAPTSAGADVNTAGQVP